MKTSTIVLKSAILFFLLTAFTCNDQSDMTCEDYTSKLEIMQVEIKNLAESSICNENFECRSIAFGSKPCGGPMGYLVYSTSIDTLAFHNLVEKYNKLEHDLNIECQRISDCMMVSPPQSLKCENNKCIAIY